MIIAPLPTIVVLGNPSQQTPSPKNSAVRQNSPATMTYWAKTYGSDMEDTPYSIQQTSDGGYIVAGWTGSFGLGGNTVDNMGDFWVLKLDSTGSVVWQKTYGGTNDDFAYGVKQTADGGYIVVGSTWSFGAGWYDFWVLKLDSVGGVVWQSAYGGGGSDNAASCEQTSDGGYIVAGWTCSFGPSFGNAWVVKLDAGGGIAWDPFSGASSHVTSVNPLNSGATTYTTSVSPTSSAAAVQDTHVVPVDTNMTVTVQSGNFVIPASNVVTVSIIVVVVLMLFVAPAYMRRRSAADGEQRDPGRVEPRDSVSTSLEEGSGLKVPPTVTTITNGTGIVARSAASVWRVGMSPQVDSGVTALKDETKQRPSGSICMVCGLGLSSVDRIVRCPYCGNSAHEDHIIEWLHVKGICPMCGHHLSENELKARVLRS
ncbi:MAG: RING-H2 finger protein [Candidatus Atabeyarchaeum deiterrae]